MSTAIDTLKIYERLRKANLGDEAAKEIAEVFKETSEGFRHRYNKSRDKRGIV
ncbi:MAG: hypothetical protein HQK88_08755 [Nitrospirae bacterium]|nr:hypothetical protein [Nitrospirota bacterium]MBF0535371.1 hypothetical protein [Nitrospirota bacterium]MBF0616891.1 hypothetical protein [Nitrospirota bacterium]